MTNESERIVPGVDCPGCGRCCEVFETAYPRVPRHEFDRVWLSEIIRFQMLAEIGDKISTRDDGDVTWLVFDFPCKHLQPDKKCAIYESPDRPLLCRKFPHKNSTKGDCPKVRMC